MPASDISQPFGSSFPEWNRCSRVLTTKLGNRALAILLAKYVLVSPAPIAGSSSISCRHTFRGVYDDGRCPSIIGRGLRPIQGGYRSFLQPLQVPVYKPVARQSRLYHVPCRTEASLVLLLQFQRRHVGGNPITKGCVTRGFETST